MPIMNVLTVKTNLDLPLDASHGDEAKPGVSDFLTVQSFSNFAMMTGTITAAWHGLQKLIPEASTLWVPYICAFAWAVISVLISLKGLKDQSGSNVIGLGNFLGAIFVGVINSLVLAGAVVGTKIATGQNP